jgi:ferredoxin
MTKDPKTGVVGYNKDACIGCRYCVAACPFGIPKWDFNNPFGKIGKCELCRHRAKDGHYAACAEVCPTGATLFGKVRDLHAEAKRRMALKPGTTTRFQRGELGGKDMSWEGQVSAYVDHIYGETEIGGTQMLKLSGVPFEKVGMPKLSGKSPASRSETIQHTLFGNLLALPILATAGLAYLIKRNSRAESDPDSGEQK